mmetsp:Transcript_111321/g.311051  ORF Transcript_111321/g.311051 Transcript_111321/m.311051 type:complete len:219 (-) Transcript_111321:66-722(-)
MRGVRLRLALLHEHEELAQHRHRFQVQRKRPSDVGRQEAVKVRVKDKADGQCRHYQIQVVQRVGLGVVGGLESRPAEVDDGAGQAQADRLAELVEPVARLVEGQVALEWYDGEEPARQDQDVALHHLQRHALDSLRGLYGHGDHQEAEHADQGRQRQQEGEVARRTDPKDGQREDGEAAPQPESLILPDIRDQELELFGILQGVHGPASGGCALSPPS